MQELPIDVAIVLIPAESASKSITASSAWIPITQRLFTIALRGSWDSDGDPNKAKLGNQIKDTMHPFLKESMIYQERMGRRITERRLEWGWIAREDERVVVVET